MQDRLEDMVERQRVIAEKWYDLKGMDQLAREKATFELLGAITAEIGEILNGEHVDGVKGVGAIRWKHWRLQAAPAVPEYVQTELVDILHFTLELLLLWGCDAEMIHRQYIDKNQENLARYKAGY